MDLFEPYKYNYLNIPKVKIKTKSNHLKLLVVDIDETLIHTIDENDPSYMKGDYSI